jgi:hypothetical protein
VQLKDFLLDQLVEAAVGFHRLEFLEPVDRLADRPEVGQHAAEPAVRDVGHAAAGGLFGDGLSGSALGADEQDGAALAGHSAQEVQRLLEHRQRASRD